MKMVGGLGVKSVKTQIFGITTTLASFHTYEGSVKNVKCVQMVSLRRWLNKDGWGTGEGGGKKCQKCPKYWELPIL